MPARRASRKPSGRRSITTICLLVWTPTRPQPKSSSVRRLSRGRLCRWRTSSTPSSGCSAPANGRQGRAILTVVRRAAQGLARLLIDLPELTGLDLAISLGAIVQPAVTAVQATPETEAAILDFLLERVRYVLEQRGSDVRNVRAVTSEDPRELRPLQARRKLDVLPEFTESPEFKQLAVLFKRVRNIAKNFTGDPSAATDGLLNEPSERALVREIEQRGPVIASSVEAGQRLSAGVCRSVAIRSDGGEVLRRHSGDGRRCGRAQCASRADEAARRLDSAVGGCFRNRSRIMRAGPV